MDINIFNVAPNIVSYDMKGYTMLFYGEPKTGKTTIASRFPNALLLAFEIGYKAIPGVKALPITKWSEFKKVLRQLDSPEAKAMYDNIIIDTADIADDYAVKHICMQQGVDNIKDIAYGQGWTMAQRELDEALRSITQMGYGLVLISHSQEKTFMDDTGAEYTRIAPTLSNKARLVVDRMSDCIGYAQPVQHEDGTTSTKLFLRGTPRFIAGSRFKYMPDYIDFSFDNLVSALHEAIDKEAAEYDGKFVTEERTIANDVREAPDFDQLMSTFNDLVSKIKEASGSQFGTSWAPRIVEITDRHLGKGKKVSDMDRSQVELLDLVVSDLEEAVANGI